MQPNQTDLELCAFSFGKVFGAVEKTRTSTGYYPTATSTLRVYQFRHDRKTLATTSRLLNLA